MVLGGFTTPTSSTLPEPYLSPTYLNRVRRLMYSDSASEREGSRSGKASVIIYIFINPAV